jgi:hypothetical protein
MNIDSIIKTVLAFIGKHWKEIALVMAGFILGRL